MMNKFNVFSVRRRLSGAALCLGLLTLAARAQAVDITFSATFQNPTCEVSVPSTLDFGTLVSSDITQGISLANPLALDVTLSKCAGFIGTAQKPGIKVTGTGFSTAGDYLFRQSTSASTNYGVRLTTSTGTVLANNTFVPSALTPATFDGGSETIPLKASVSCGSKCSDVGTRAGTLSAVVTFAFVWQ